MGIGPIGSAIFTNQMTPAATHVQNAQNNRIDFQNMAAQAAVNEKEEEVLDVRPAEENQEVNEDKDHTRDEADRESKRNKKEEDDEDEAPSESIHTLDITI